MLLHRAQNPPKPSSCPQQHGQAQAVGCLSGFLQSARGQHFLPTPPTSRLCLSSLVPVSSFQRNRRIASPINSLPLHHSTSGNHLHHLGRRRCRGTQERKLPVVGTCSLTHCPVRDFPVLSSLTFRTSLGGKYCYLFSDKDAEMEGPVAHTC